MQLTVTWRGKGVLSNYAKLHSEVQEEAARDQVESREFEEAMV